MKNIALSKKQLGKIKLSSFLLLLVSILFVSLNHRLIGFIICILALAIEWRLYRCPNCNHDPDIRINLNKNPYCPHCDKKIN